MLSEYPVSMTHFWLTAGTDSVKAQTKDVNEVTSSWSVKHRNVIMSVGTKTFVGSNDDNGSSVQQTSDDGYIIAGYTGSFCAVLLMSI